MTIRPTLWAENKFRVSETRNPKTGEKEDHKEEKKAKRMSNVARLHPP